MSLRIRVQEEAGCVVGYAPGIDGSRVKVSLRKVAERLIAKGRLRQLSAAEFAALDRMGRGEVGGVEVSGKIARGIKKVAKKVASSKVVKAVAKVAAKVVPAPASYAITGAQAAAKLGKAIKNGNKKAKKVAPAVKAAAQGKINGAQLTKAAKAAGVDPKLAMQAAAVGKVAMLAAQGDSKAAAAMNVAEQLTSPNVEEQEAAADTISQLSVVKAAQSGDASAFMVTAPDGKQYRTMVVPA